jgi:hypothetical protein
MIESWRDKLIVHVADRRKDYEFDGVPGSLEFWAYKGVLTVGWYPRKDSGREEIERKWILVPVEE